MKAPTKILGWTMFSLSVAIIIGIVLIIFWLRGYFNKTSTVHVNPTPANSNQPDGATGVAITVDYNFSEKTVDLTYNIFQIIPSNVEPESYKIYLQPSNAPSGQPSSSAIYLDSVPYQNTSTIKVTRTYSIDKFSDLECSNNYSFALWGYKNSFYSNSYVSSMPISSIFYYHGVPENLPPTEASYIGVKDGAPTLKIIKSSFSYLPCWNTVGEYQVGYLTRTSLDGSNWGSPIIIDKTTTLPDYVIFPPANPKQTSYVQIAAGSYGNLTTKPISDWSNTITVPASSS